MRFDLASGSLHPTGRAIHPVERRAVSDIIALLHFADNSMEQAGSDHFVLT